MKNQTLIPPLPPKPAKVDASNYRTAYDKPLTQADYDQGCYGIALFFLVILIPVVLGISLCHLFTGKRSR